jgi:hypothetical protein
MIDMTTIVIIIINKDIVIGIKLVVVSEVEIMVGMVVTDINYPIEDDDPPRDLVLL